jgi:hypothetical protein
MKLRYISTLTPAHKHDCETCTFHGSLKVSVKAFGVDTVDVYTCDEFAIVRLSDEDSNNLSYDLDMIAGLQSKIGKFVNAVLQNGQKPEWNASLIKERLLISDKWVTQGVLSIFDYQTEEEQDSEDTFEDNGVGFNGVDAELLSSYAKFAKKAGFLTEGQMKYARKKMLKYSGQLAKIANLKADQKERVA